MPKADQHFQATANRLRAEGSDPLRLEVLAVAGRFKRSWLDMAQALLRVRERSAFEQWGYPDLYSYCVDELLIKRGTADKLLMSYATLERHKPEVLSWDGFEQRIPDYDSVAYLGRALGEGREERPNHEYDDARIDALKQAIFDDRKPLAAIRREFNPVFFSKSDEDREREVLERAHASAKRLAALLPQLPGISKARRRSAEAALRELQEELEALLPAPRTASRFANASSLASS